MADQKIGWLGALALLMGINVGGSLFSLTGVAIGVSGPSAVIAIGLAVIPILLVLPAYLTFLKLYPTWGGHYRYPSRLLSNSDSTVAQYVGFVPMWASLFATTAGFAIWAETLGRFLLTAFPGIPLSAQIIGLIGLLVAAMINYFGIKTIGIVEIGLFFLMMIGLLIFIGFGLLNVQAANFNPLFPSGVGPFVASIGLVYTMAAGAILIVDLGGGIRDAARSLPSVLIVGVLLTVILDVLVAFVAVGVVGYSNMANEVLTVPAQEFLSGILLQYFAVGAAAIAVMTTFFGVYQAGCRWFEVLAADGIFPKSFATKNKWDVPTVPLIVYLIISSALLLSPVSLGFLAAALGFDLLLLTGVIALTGLRFPSEFPELFEEADVLWSARTLQVTSGIGLLLMVLIFIVVAVFQTTSFIGFAVMVGVGTIYYVARKYYLASNNEQILPMFNPQSLLAEEASDDD